MKRLKNSSEVLDAISQVREMPITSAGVECTVCVKTSSGELVGHFRLPSYAHVRALAGRMRALGYGMSIMHPEHTDCDFILEEPKGPPTGTGRS